MADVYEIRHDNLLRLIQEYGSIAEINERLGRKRNDAALTIVKIALSVLVVNRGKWVQLLPERLNRVSA